MSQSAMWPAVQRAAIISTDGRYRYTLERSWGQGDRWALFVMLNPSTADASADDPTIRRCMGFAQRERCDGLIVWNLYAYRATDPAELDRVDDPIGRENEDHLWRIVLGQDGPVPELIVAAWGAMPNRGRYVSRELSVRNGALYERDVVCLGRTMQGHPRHPLYVRGDAPLLPYNLRDERAPGPTVGAEPEHTPRGPSASSGGQPR